MRQIQRFYRVLNKEMDSIGSKCKKKTYYASRKFMHCKQQSDS